MNATIARHPAGMAAAQPGAAALRVPRGRTASGAISCQSLSLAGPLAETDAWRRSLRSRGLRRGDRTPVRVGPRLPADIRHNAKTHRLALARWAAPARACRAA